MFLRQFFWTQQNLGGAQKTWGPCPRMPCPVARGLVLRTKVAFTLTRVKYIAF